MPKKMIRNCVELIIFVFLSAFFIAPSFAKDEINQSNNTVNGGLAVKANSYIFYRNSSDKGALYRFDIKSQKNIKIVNGNVFYINLCGNKIYYFDIKTKKNQIEDGTIYSINFDGKDKKVIEGSFASVLEASNINILPNKDIFYLDTEAGFAKYGEPSKEFAINNEGISNVVLEGGWAFYSWADWHNEKSKTNLYKIPINKKEGTNSIKNSKLIIKDDIGNFIVQNGIIYYVNNSDNGKLYSIKTDGSKKKKISDIKVNYLNTDGKYIYFTKKENDKLYRMNIKGRNIKLLDNKKCKWINITGDWIYFLEKKNATIKLSDDIYQAKVQENIYNYNVVKLKR